jgi:hypothetical protein
VGGLSGAAAATQILTSGSPAQRREEEEAGFPVGTGGTVSSHIELLGHLIPGQSLITQLQDLLCGSGTGQVRRDPW